jgi:hypothetical protein
LFVITKTKNLRLELKPKLYVPNCSRNIGEQDYGDHGVDGDHEVNPMEENDDINIIENDRINRLIHDTFAPMDDNFDDVHDVPLIDKAQKPLYEGSRKNLLSVVLLLVNLKVLNGLSNTYLTQILKYAI